MTTLPFEEFIDSCREESNRQFRSTDDYYRLNEQREQVEKILKLQFSEQEFRIIGDYIDQITALHSVRTIYLYRKAFFDCVSLLKQLKIL